LGLYFELSKIGFWVLGLVSKLDKTSTFLGLQGLEEGVKQAYEGVTCEASKRYIEACLPSFFLLLSLSHWR